jgi:hypothetical protein
MPELTGGDQRFRDDRGAADPGVLAALAAFADGSGSEQAALTALADSRLLVPVVAVLAQDLSTGAPYGDDCAGGVGGVVADDAVSGAGGAGGVVADDAVSGAGGVVADDAGSGVGGVGGVGGAVAGDAPAARFGPDGGEKASDMAMPTIVGRDGRRALPAFTSLESLSRWLPAGRPVPVPAAAVWRSAVEESCAVVIDIAGPVPVAVEGARLTALAQGLPVPVLHEDPDVWRLAAVVAAEHAPGIRVRLSAAQAGLDLTVELAPPAGVVGEVPDHVASSVGEALSAQLAERAPRGIAVVAVAANPGLQSRD